MPAVGPRLLAQIVAFLLEVAALGLQGRAVATDAQITVGAVTGKPGERVTLAVAFDPGIFEVNGFSHDLFFDPLTTVAARPVHPRPACSVAVANPARQAAYRFLPEGCARGSTCAGIHVLFLALDNTAIGKIRAYTCTVTISDDAPPGRYPVVCEVPRAGVDDYELPVQCVDGEIAVVTCLGDCSFDNQVTVNELLAGVNLALGVPETEDCAVAWDVDRDGEVRITDLIQGVNNALDGCGTARARAALSGAGVRKRRETREVANDQ